VAEDNTLSRSAGFSGTSGPAEVYAHLADDPLRGAVDRTAARIAEAMAGSARGAPRNPEVACGQKPRTDVIVLFYLTHIVGKGLETGSASVTYSGSAARSWRHGRGTALEDADDNVAPLGRTQEDATRPQCRRCATSAEANSGASRTYRPSRGAEFPPRPDGNPGTARRPPRPPEAQSIKIKRERRAIYL
jgi:hypothetical protein